MTTSTEPAANARQSTLSFIAVSAVYTVVSVVALGLIYPLVIWAIGSVLFHAQAEGSLVRDARGVVIGSALVGQNWTKPRYFQGRPSAAGKGYDPTSTGGTNFGPTSKKLLDSTKSAIDRLKKGNPDATGPIPMDLVTSSASGIDPDISPEAAYYQVPRVAMARGIARERVRALVDAYVVPRQFGLLGEPHVNVFALNRALDAQRVPVK